MILLIKLKTVQPVEGLGLSSMSLVFFIHFPLAEDFKSKKPLNRAQKDTLVIFLGNFLSEDDIKEENQMSTSILDISKPRQIFDKSITHKTEEIHIYHQQME